MDNIDNTEVQEIVEDAPAKKPVAKKAKAKKAPAKRKTIASLIKEMCANADFITTDKIKVEFAKNSIKTITDLRKKNKDELENIISVAITKSAGSVIYASPDLEESLVTYLQNYAGENNLHYNGLIVRRGQGDLEKALRAQLNEDVIYKQL